MDEPTLRANSRPFNHFAQNHYSENGEDGVIAEILSRLEINPNSPKWCVEFGAWDGKLGSTTFRLVESGYYAVYIESNPERFQLLLNTARFFPNIVPVCAEVSYNSSSEDSLSNILNRTQIPSEFEILSIDIDSYDLDVWETFTFYWPKIVIIEINSSVFPGILQRHSIKTPSNSFSSTLNVGVKKGYTLVCHTGNLIFVRNDLVHTLMIPQRFIDYPELLFLYDSIWMAGAYPRRTLLSRIIHRLIPVSLIRILKK